MYKLNDSSSSSQYSESEEEEPELLPPPPPGFSDSHTPAKTSDTRSGGVQLLGGVRDWQKNNGDVSSVLTQTQSIELESLRNMSKAVRDTSAEMGRNERSAMVTKIKPNLLSEFEQRKARFESLNLQKNLATCESRRNDNNNTIRSDHVSLPTECKYSNDSSSSERKHQTGYLREFLITPPPPEFSRSISEHVTRNDDFSKSLDFERENATLKLDKPNLYVKDSSSGNSELSLHQDSQEERRSSLRLPSYEEYKNLLLRLNELNNGNDEISKGANSNISELIQLHATDNSMNKGQTLTAGRISHEAQSYLKRTLRVAKSTVFSKPDLDSVGTAKPPIGVRPDRRQRPARVLRSRDVIDLLCSDVDYYSQMENQAVASKIRLEVESSQSENERKSETARKPAELPSKKSTQLQEQNVNEQCKSPLRSKKNINSTGSLRSIGSQNGGSNKSRVSILDRLEIYKCVSDSESEAKDDLEEMRKKSVSKRSKKLEQRDNCEQYAVNIHSGKRSENIKELDKKRYEPENGTTSEVNIYATIRNTNIRHRPSTDFKQKNSDIRTNQQQQNAKYEGLRLADLQDTADVELCNGNNSATAMKVTDWLMKNSFSHDLSSRAATKRSEGIPDDGNQPITINRQSDTGSRITTKSREGEKRSEKFQKKAIDATNFRRKTDQDNTLSATSEGTPKKLSMSPELVPVRLSKENQRKNLQSNDSVGMYTSLQDSCDVTAKKTKRNPDVNSQINNADFQKASKTLEKERTAQGIRDIRSLPVQPPAKPLRANRQMFENSEEPIYHEPWEISRPNSDTKQKSEKHFDRDNVENYGKASNEVVLRKNQRVIKSNQHIQGGVSERNPSENIENNGNNHGNSVVRSIEPNKMPNSKDLNHSCSNNLVLNDSKTTPKSYNNAQAKPSSTNVIAVTIELGGVNVGVTSDISTSITPSPTPMPRRRKQAKLNRNLENGIGSVRECENDDFSKQIINKQHNRKYENIELNKGSVSAINSAEKKSVLKSEPILQKSEPVLQKTEPVLYRSQELRKSHRMAASFDDLQVVGTALSIGECFNQDDIEVDDADEEIFARHDGRRLSLREKAEEFFSTERLRNIVDKFETLNQDRQNKTSSLKIGIRSLTSRRGSQKSRPSIISSALFTPDHASQPIRDDYHEYNQAQLLSNQSSGYSEYECIESRGEAKRNSAAEILRREEKRKSVRLDVRINDDDDVNANGEYNPEIWNFLADEMMDDVIDSSELLTQKQKRESKTFSCDDCGRSIVNQSELSLHFDYGSRRNLCEKCKVKVKERKQTIQEIIESELRYGRDIKIIKQEFYEPLRSNGLLTSDQLDQIFINIDELITINDYFCSRLILSLKPNKVATSATSYTAAADSLAEASKRFSTCTFDSVDVSTSTLAGESSIAAGATSIIDTEIPTTAIPLTTNNTEGANTSLAHTSATSATSFTASVASMSSQDVSGKDEMLNVESNQSATKDRKSKDFDSCNKTLSPKEGVTCNENREGVDSNGMGGQSVECNNSDRQININHPQMGGANESKSSYGDCTGVGKAFLDAANMLMAYETYCVNHSTSSTLLEKLSNEREILKVWLDQSQLENDAVRKMPLKAFLIMPVQRVMKYPLLLSRLLKCTPAYDLDKQSIATAKNRIEQTLAIINSKTTGTIRQKRGSVGGGRGKVDYEGGGIYAWLNRRSLVDETLELTQASLDQLQWNRNECYVVLMGVLQMTLPPSGGSRWSVTEPLTYKYQPVNCVLVTLGMMPNYGHPTTDRLYFSQDSTLRSAAIVVLKEKNSKFCPVREALYLDRCIVTMDEEECNVFSIEELNKDSLLVKTDNIQDVNVWYWNVRMLTKDLGRWRRRRFALPNIMTFAASSNNTNTTNSGTNNATCSNPNSNPTFSSTSNSVVINSVAEERATQDLSSLGCNTESNQAGLAGILRKKNADFQLEQPINDESYC